MNSKLVIPPKKCSWSTFHTHAWRSWETPMSNWSQSLRSTSDPQFFWLPLDASSLDGERSTEARRGPSQEPSPTCTTPSWMIWCSHPKLLEKERDIELMDLDFIKCKFLMSTPHIWPPVCRFLEEKYFDALEGKRETIESLYKKLTNKEITLSFRED